MLIRPAQIEDAAAIAAIYNHEVAHGTSVFDLRPRTLADQELWLTERAGIHAVIVAEDEAGQVLGFASLSRYKDRPGYNTTVEDSVYVDPEARGLGVGSQLLTEIIAVARRHGFHTVLGRIAAENEVSIAAHAKVGFTEVGTEREVGRKFGRWLDVVTMQKML